MDGKVETKLDPNRKVTKSNSLVEARYRLTLNEIRLILAYISLITPKQDDFPTVRLKVREIKDLLDLGGESLYAVLLRTLEKLRSRVVKIPKPENNGFIVTGWIDRAEYNGKKGELEITLSRDLKPYLLQLREKFTSYHLRNVLKLRSVYAVRMYELLKQYESVGKRIIDLKELKEMLGIENEYKLYGHFKSKVLMKAQKELKEKTDIYFDFAEIKKGRKVVALEFIIRRKEDREPPPLPPSRPFDTVPDKVKEALIEYLRTKENIKSPLAVAKSMSEFEIEETAREALREALYDSYGHPNDWERE